VNVFGALGPRAIAWFATRRDVRVSVEGLENVPRVGPALIAARHYHHLHDGVALVTLLPRTPHIFVALDWARTRAQRFVMETVCRISEFPVILRPENLDDGTSAFDRSEVLRYTRRALELSTSLLARGELLVVFPEGHPTIDPVRRHKTGDTAFLPFRPGLLAIVARAERAAQRSIPIVPAGLAYRRTDRFDVTLRFGEPLQWNRDVPRETFLATLGDRVRELSGVT